MIPESKWPVGIAVWQGTATKLQGHLAEAFPAAEALLAQICICLQQVPPMDFAKSESCRMHISLPSTVLQAVNDLGYRVCLSIYKHDSGLFVGDTHQCHDHDYCHHETRLSSAMPSEVCTALHILGRRQHLQIRCIGGDRTRDGTRDDIEVTLGLNKS